MIKNVIGHFGENLACNYLKTKNYQILERNYRLGHLELDLIAKKDSQFFLFEIKTRRYYQTKSGEALISKVQTANLKKAARLYAAKNNLNFTLIHFDLILIIADYKQGAVKLEHYQNIF
jgi:putative endonuclease